MGDKRDQGSKLNQLYHDGGGSKIDQLYGSPRKDDATKAAEMERRVDQKMYRDAVRNKDYKAVAAFHARPGFQATGGITRHGQFDAQDKKTGENFTQEGQRLYNNGQPDNRSANEIERAASKPSGTGDGSTAANAASHLPEGSTGGKWVNVGPSATGDAATDSRASGAPANSDSKETSSVQKSKSPILNARQAFADDLTSSELIKFGDTKAMDRAFSKGESLGVSRDQVLAFLNKENDAIEVNEGVPDMVTPMADPKPEQRMRLEAPWNLNNPPRNASDKEKSDLARQQEARDQFNEKWATPAKPKRPSGASGQWGDGSPASLGEAVSADLKNISGLGRFLDDVFVGAGDSLLSAPRKIAANYYGALASIPAMPLKALPGKTGEYARKNDPSGKAFSLVRDFVSGENQKTRANAEESALSMWP